jgi:hypothetical protein
MPCNMAKRREQRTPVGLIVLDGWGFRPGRVGNAIELGETPTWHRLWSRAPRTLLHASGLPVGLPEGQIGNSEVGHLNLGAGRVVPQDMVRITQSIASGEFFRLAPLVDLCRSLRESGGTLHLLALLGRGGVHALDTHLLAGVRLGAEFEVPVAIHAWLDGRDTPPRSALGFMEELLQAIGRSGGQAVVSTVIGRYFAMDRDKRWDRIKFAYDVMVHGTGEPAADPLSAIRRAYDAGETDEFIKPRVITGAPRIARDGMCVHFGRTHAPDRRRSRPGIHRVRRGPGPSACHHDAIRPDAPVQAFGRWCRRIGQGAQGGSYVRTAKPAYLLLQRWAPAGARSGRPVKVATRPGARDERSGVTDVVEPSSVATSFSVTTPRDVVEPGPGAAVSGRGGRSLSGPSW